MFPCDFARREAGFLVVFFFFLGRDVVDLPEREEEREEEALRFLVAAKKDSPSFLVKFTDCSEKTDQNDLQSAVIQA